MSSITPQTVQLSQLNQENALLLLAVLLTRLPHLLFFPSLRRQSSLLENHFVACRMLLTTDAGTGRKKTVVGTGIPMNYQHACLFRFLPSDHAEAVLAGTNWDGRWMTTTWAVPLATCWASS